MERQVYLPPQVTTELKCLIFSVKIFIMKLNNQQCFQDTTDQDAADSTAGCDFFYLKYRGHNIAAKLLTDSFRRRTSQYKRNRF